MWLSKTNELIGTSPVSFEGAVEEILLRANRTLRGVTGIEVLSKDVSVSGEQIREYRVRARLQFDMAPETIWHW